VQIKAAADYLRQGATIGNGFTHQSVVLGKGETYLDAGEFSVV
jgi:hypothetical protein